MPPPPPGAGVTGAGVTGAGVTGAGVTGAGVTGAGVTGAGVTGAGVVVVGQSEGLPQLLVLWQLPQSAPKVSQWPPGRLWQLTQVAEVWLWSILICTKVAGGTK